MAQKNGRMTPHQSAALTASPRGEALKADEREMVVYARFKGEKLLHVDMPEMAKDAFSHVTKLLALVVIADVKSGGCDEETGIRFADKACEIAKKAILEGVAEYFKETGKNAKD